MTDHSDDDSLRAALRAEAAAVEADSALLARIRASIPTPPDCARPRSGRRRLLAVAAAVILTAGTVAALTLGDGDPGDEQVEVADPDRTDGIVDPAGPCPPDAEIVATFVPAATDQDVLALAGALRLRPDVRAVRAVSPDRSAGVLADIFGSQDHYGTDPGWVLLIDAQTYADAEPVAIHLSHEVPIISGMAFLCAERTQVSIPPPDQDGPGVGQPTFLALLREDGVLTTVDLSTGVTRQLHAMDDPRAEHPEGGPFSIDDVEIAGGWVYFGTCCEPAVGLIYRIPVDGGAPEPVGYGTDPEVTPDGRYLAAGAGTEVVVYDLGQLDDRRGDDLPYLEPAARLEAGEQNGPFSWSADGTRLAWTSFESGAFEEHSANEHTAFHEAAFDGRGLERLSDPFAPEPGVRTRWFLLHDEEDRLVHGRMADDLRRVASDPTRRWFLWVDRSHTIRRAEGLDGAALPLEGLPPALAADW